MTANKADKLPDWWQREKQRRMLRVLIFLLLLCSLIVYYYYMSANGLTGIISGVNFDTHNYVAFVRDDGNGHTDLYAVKADGTGERRLTAASDSSTKAHPVWTMDGKSLLYTSNLDDARLTQIYILGNGQPTRLTYGSGNKGYATVSPDGQHAAFISQGAVKSVYLNGKDVYQLMPQPRSGNEAGNENAAVLNSEPQGPFLNFSFSADGTGVAGAQDFADESSAINAERMGVDMAVTCIPPGGGATMVLESGHEVSCAWDKTGNRLAASFTELHASNRSEKTDHNGGYKDWMQLNAKDKDTTLVSAIQIFTFTGKKQPEVRNVFRGIGYSVEPKNIAWSPDGTRMAFEGWRLKGEGQRELKGIVVMRLDQDPTGQGVVVDAAHVDSLQYLLPADASGLPQNPRWSPDGLHLLYELRRPDGKRDLWCINSDGTNRINLTKGKGDCYDGSWAPLK